MNEVKKDIFCIVTDVQNGVEGSFDELYHESVRFAYGVASLYLNNESDIEDVLQNSFMYVSTGIKDLKKPESFYRWLRVIVRHECQKHIGKKTRYLINPLIEFNEDEIELGAYEASLPEFVEQTELRDEVSEILDKLPESKRMCIVLFYFEQQTVEQISQTLGISVGTVKSRLHGARKIIEKEFGKLKNKDSRLYGVSVIPLLSALLVCKVQQAVVPVAVESGVMGAVAAGNATAVGSAAGAAAVTTASATGGAATAAAATTATGVAAGTAAGAAATAVTVKVAAVVSAVAVVTGGAVATKNYIENRQQESVFESSSSYMASVYEQEEYGTVESFTYEETSAEVTNGFTQNSSVQVTSGQSEVISVTTHALTTVSNVSQVSTTRLPTTTEQTTVPTTQRPTTTAAPTTENSTTQQSVLNTTAQPTTAVSDAFSVSSGVLTEYKASDSNVTVPSSANGSVVTAIGTAAFSGNTSVKNVSLPSSVTRIGQEAFSDCTNLSSVSLPSSLESIGIGAFYGCSSLKSVTVPSGVTTIGDEAFADCSALTSVTIPSSVTSIGDYVFDGCNSLTIRCTEGSAAHDYAVENSINYELI